MTLPPASGPTTARATFSSGKTPALHTAEFGTPQRKPFSGTALLISKPGLPLCGVPASRGVFQSVLSPRPTASHKSHPRSVTPGRDDSLRLVQTRWQNKGGSKDSSNHSTCHHYTSSGVHRQVKFVGSMEEVNDGEPSPKSFYCPHSTACPGFSTRDV